MINSIKQTIAVCLLSAVAVGFTVPIRAADKPDEKPATPPEAAKKPRSRGIPFTGKLGAVDQVAKTITVKGKEKDRVFQITSQTRIMKAGKSATLEDGVVGEDVSGSARQAAEGKMEAVSVRFGPRPEGEGAKGGDKAKPKVDPKVEPKGDDKKAKD